MIYLLRVDELWSNDKCLETNRPNNSLSNGMFLHRSRRLLRNYFVDSDSPNIHCRLHINTCVPPCSGERFVWPASIPTFHRRRDSNILLVRSARCILNIVHRHILVFFCRNDASSQLSREDEQQIVPTLKEISNQNFSRLLNFRNIHLLISWSMIAIDSNGP